MENSNAPDRICFFKGKNLVTCKQIEGSRPEEKEVDIKTIRDSLTEALNSKNLSFLLGSGCSSHFGKDKEGKEKQLGIDTMASLAKIFFETTEKRNKRKDSKFLNITEKRKIKEILGLDINFKSSPYKDNLEEFMNVLYNWRFALKESGRTPHKGYLGVVEKSINKLKKYIFDACNKALSNKNSEVLEENNKVLEKNNEVLENYKLFYKKLVYRDNTLPAPWIFTTNYDLYNEKAMDFLGINYMNGFSGTIDRRFNPITFRYALYKELGLSNKQKSVIDNLIYLCKLHGSISWVEDKETTNFFPIKEVQQNVGSHPETESLIIYPASIKHGTSLSFPYSDLFREFHSQIVQEQSILFVMGYSFGDQHINNIIYQALTLSSFRLIIFADPGERGNGEIQKIKDLEDPRIWIIYGHVTGENNEKKRAHYFDCIVNKLLPDLSKQEIDDRIAKILKFIKEGYND